MAEPTQGAIARQFSWQNVSDRLGRVVMVVLGDFMKLQRLPGSFPEVIGVAFSIAGALWTGKNTAADELQEENDDLRRRLAALEGRPDA